MNPRKLYIGWGGRGVEYILYCMYKGRVFTVQYRNPWGDRRERNVQYRETK